MRVSCPFGMGEVGRIALSRCVSLIKGLSLNVSGGISPFFVSGRGMIEEAQVYQALVFRGSGLAGSVFGF